MNKSNCSLTILFADDESSLQRLMFNELEAMGHTVTVCPDGLTAVAALEKNTYDCLLVDLDMPGLTGIEVMAKAKEMTPHIEAIVLTGKSSVETAIEALRLGAFDYLTKPCKLTQLKSLLERVAEKRELTNKCRALQTRLQAIEGKSNLVGQSKPMQQVTQLISKVAQAPASVLIRGETGTGKELVARSIHDQSLRAGKPFVAVNCGALPENLIESELFGHRKGAFTGADEQRVGLFEMADGGTLFLDEIGELPKSMQATLLRVLESGEIRRVGDSQTFKVDVRILCATHRSLEEMVTEKLFREDLMFRINTFEIRIPPLKERLDDIPLLAAHLYQRFSGTAGDPQSLFTTEAIKRLTEHPWPGNIRELANTIEHATILCSELPIDVEHLPGRFSDPQTVGSLSQVTIASGPISLRELEIQAINAALDRHQGNKPKVAQELGISLKTLYNKLNQASDLEKSA